MGPFFPDHDHRGQDIGIRNLPGGRRHSESLSPGKFCGTKKGQHRQKDNNKKVIRRMLFLQSSRDVLRVKGDFD